MSTVSSLMRPQRYARLARVVAAIVFFLPFSFCSACASTTPEEGVHRSNEQFEKNARAKDLEKLIREYYAKDAIVAFGGPKRVSGLEAAREAWREMLEKGVVELQTERIEAGADLVSEMGRWTLRVEPEARDVREEHGSYMVTWRREGGTWKAVMQLFVPEGIHEAE